MGFSPGVAARLRTANDRRVFVKAVGPKPNPGVPAIHRREAEIMALLPTAAPVPRLLWFYDDGEWVVLVFEQIDGQNPAQPWRADELDRVLDALVILADVLTPSPLPPGTTITASDTFASRISGWRQLYGERSLWLDRLDAWSVRHLEALAEMETGAPAAVDGNTLLHFDVRADNILLTADRVWFVDWPLACVGAAWVDVVFFAPSVRMQGGPPSEEIVARHPACQMANPASVTAAVASIAGLFTHWALQPSPPGLPTLRAFQAAQGVVAREWLAERTGLA
jgi:aminoglycoside phosphotransferase (APT) family kinase protein